MITSVKATICVVACVALIGVGYVAVRSKTDRTKSGYQETASPSPHPEKQPVLPSAPVQPTPTKRTPQAAKGAAIDKGEIDAIIKNSVNNLPKKPIGDDFSNMTLQERTAYHIAQLKDPLHRGDSISSLVTLALTSDEKTKAYVCGELGRELRENDDNSVRGVCAGILGSYGREAIPHLVHALHSDKDRGVRRQAAQALGATPGGEKELKELEIAVKEDQPVPYHGYQVATAAIHSIGTVGGKKAYDILMDLWHAENPKDREAIVLAMGKTGCPEAIDTLKGFLQNEDVWMKGTAVIALGNMAGRCRKDPAVVGRVVEILEQYKEDSNPQIKKNTRMVLDRLKKYQE